MAETAPTVGDLYLSGGITDADLRSAAIAYLADPLMGSYVFPSGYRLDIGASVRSNEWAFAQYRSPETDSVMKRVAVRTAILLARPDKDVTAPRIQARALQALRAVALHPHGLRRAAHPFVMPALIKLGYVTERQARWKGAEAGEMGRFLTPAGRELMKALGEK